MKKLTRKLSLYWRRERPVVTSVVLAVGNAVQVAAIPLPTWAHTAIIVVTALLGGSVIRDGVTPAVGASGVPDVASDDLLSDEARREIAAAA